MKNAPDNKKPQLRTLTVAVALILMGLMSSCAPTDPKLKNELLLLRQQQQQQQQALLAVQQQLVQLQQQTGVMPQIAAERENPAAVIEPQSGTSLRPAADEVENLVEAASSYLEAFSALAMGHYEQAQKGFSTFLQNFTQHRYAPNARYWLAETEIALGLLQQAEENLLLVANDHDREGKAPAALSRLAQLYQQQNLTEQSENILHQLRTRFPKSPEAQHFNRSEQTR